MIYYRLISWTCICLCALLGWRAAGAAEKVNFAYSAIAGAQAIPWITKEAGLFEKHGLDLQMIYIDGGPRAAQALLAGEIPLIQAGGAAPVAATLRGGALWSSCRRPIPRPATRVPRISSTAASSRPSTAAASSMRCIDRKLERAA